MSVLEIRLVDLRLSQCLK